MRNSNLSSEIGDRARKPQKNGENNRKRSGKSQKNVKKWHFLQKPQIKDFKNGGFYILKIRKTDSWKKIWSNSDVHNKYIQAGCVPARVTQLPFALALPMLGIRTGDAPLFPPPRDTICNQPSGWAPFLRGDNLPSSSPSTSLLQA